jgi:hypothetical protein
MYIKSKPNNTMPINHIAYYYHKFESQELRDKVYAKLHSKGFLVEKRPPNLIRIKYYDPPNPSKQRQQATQKFLDNS